MKTSLGNLLACLALTAAITTFSACSTKHPAGAAKTVTPAPVAAAPTPAPAPAAPAAPAAPTAPETPATPPVAAAAPAAPAVAPADTNSAATTEPATPAKLSVVKVDSEETAGEDAKGANAVDGDPATMWHTQWQDSNPPCPHEITIELTPPSTIKGFTYLPRQDDSDNGTIKDYEFYVSDDGQDFGQPLAKGTFETGKEKKTVTFDAKKCRFIKLKALSEVNDQAWTSVAEIGVIQ